ADPQGHIDDEHAVAFDAFKKALSTRYGSWDAAKNTAYEDPVGFLLDASAVLSGGASLARRVGLDAAATGLRVGSEITNPVAIAARVVSPVAKLAGGAAAQVLGKTTGVGADAIKTAAKGGEAFEAGLRGAADHASAADDLLSAAQDVAEQRR